MTRQYTMAVERPRAVKRLFAKGLRLTEADKEEIPRRLDDAKEDEKKLLTDTDLHSTIV